MWTCEQSRFGHVFSSWCGAVGGLHGLHVSPEMSVSVAQIAIHLPPGQGSIFIGIALPSGVSLSGPICSSKAAKMSSSVARTWISCVATNVRLGKIFEKA